MPPSLRRPRRWRATIASVNDLLAYRDLHKDTQIEVDLLAAWPEELL